MSVDLHWDKNGKIYSHSCSMLKDRIHIYIHMQLLGKYDFINT